MKNARVTTNALFHWSLAMFRLLSSNVVLYIIPILTACYRTIWNLSVVTQIMSNTHSSEKFLEYKYKTICIFHLLQSQSISAARSEAFYISQTQLLCTLNAFTNVWADSYQTGPVLVWISVYPPFKLECYQTGWENLWTDNTSNIGQTQLLCNRAKAQSIFVSSVLWLSLP